MSDIYTAYDKYDYYYNDDFNANEAMTENQNCDECNYSEIDYNKYIRTVYDDDDYEDNSKYYEE